MKKQIIALLAKRSLGTGMVEFAMGATIFLMLMFTIIEMAMVVYSYNTISHAARDVCATRSFIRRPVQSRDHRADQERRG